MHASTAPRAGRGVLDFAFWSAARGANNTLIRTASSRGPLIVRRDAAGAGQIWRDNDERPAPAITKVVVRPNLYEKGRAHVTVVNWGKDTKAQVDATAMKSATCRIYWGRRSRAVRSRAARSPFHGARVRTRRRMSSEPTITASARRARKRVSVCCSRLKSHSTPPCA